MSIFLKGFLVGLAYVAPIGMQNLFVINTAISKSFKRTAQVVLIIICLDISLALSSYFGMGALIRSNEILGQAIKAVGSVAIIIIGINLIKSNVQINEDVNTNVSLGKMAISAFSVTWLNPHAIIASAVLLGAGSNSELPADKAFFIIGVCLASAVWFIFLSMFTFFLKRFFNEKTLKIINIVSGVIISYFGIKLANEFLQSLR